ncbi:MAG TPA: OsmC family protein, partial [Saprospiraceae bacterium]|nr:OsmC family protein [Saprospiraceae bacterium]
VPAVFTKINLHFYLKGHLRPDRVEEALRLAVEKYCSVSRMLEPTAQITWEYSIENGATHEI